MLKKETWSLICSYLFQQWRIFEWYLLHWKVDICYDFKMDTILTKFRLKWVSYNIVLKTRLDWSIELGTKLEINLGKLVVKQVKTEIQTCFQFFDRFGF